MDGEANSLVHVNVELGKEAEKTACDLLRSLVGTAVTEAAGLLGDQVKYWKWANTVRLARKVEERLNKGGVAKRVLPPSFAVPALEGAASVDDESVQDMWAALLASGVKDDGAQRPAYVQTLKSIGGTEAAVLQQIIRGGGLYDTRKFAMASVPDWERAAVMLLQSLGVLAPVIDVRPRDAGPNRYEFSADAYILEVAPYGWDFAGAVAPEVVAWSTREVYRPKNAHHFTPRFE